MPSKKIIITGTHHTPAIELIKQLRHDSKFTWQIYYISHQYPTETHLVNSVIPLVGQNFYSLNCGKFDRRFLIKTLTGIPTTLIAIVSSIKLLFTIKPDVVVSFGGYVSVPVVIASRLLHLPTITHEQTHTIGLSTKINHFFGAHPALSFPNPSFPQATVTGNLLRSEIYNTNPTILKNFKLKIKNYPLIYISGGNQGSLFLNTIISNILPQLVKKYTVIHQTGISKNTPQFTHSNYLAKEYINTNEIGPILHSARLLISRGGANTTQEIAALKKPAIIIPHPYTQQNEQLLNATWLKKQQPAQTIILDQLTATPQKLIKAVDQLARRHHSNNITHYTPNLQLLSLIYELL